MTTLILKMTAAPSFDGIRRLGKAVNGFFALLAEIKQMERDAQRRYPFMIE